MHHEWQNVYDNSMEDADAKPLFRLSNGLIAKLYSDVIPEWASFILTNK